MVPCSRLRTPVSDDTVEEESSVSGGGNTEEASASTSNGYSPSDSEYEPDESGPTDRPMGDKDEGDEQSGGTEEGVQSEEEVEGTEVTEEDVPSTSGASACDDEPPARKKLKRALGKLPHKSKPGDEDWLHLASKARWTDEEVEKVETAYARAGYKILVPNVLDRVHLPPPGYIGVYVSLFRLGLRFPMPHFLSFVLHLIGIPLYAYSPNSICMIIAFLQICHDAGVEPTVRLFRFFFLVSRGHEGYWSISSRKNKILVENLYSKVVYRDNYIFVRYRPDAALPAPLEFDLSREWAREDLITTIDEFGELEKLWRLSWSDRDARYLTSSPRAYPYTWPTEPLMADALDAALASCTLDAAKIRPATVLRQVKRKLDVVANDPSHKKPRPSGKSGSTATVRQAPKDPLPKPSKDTADLSRRHGSKDGKKDESPKLPQERASDPKASEARIATTTQDTVPAVWPYVGPSAPSKGPIHASCASKLVYFAPTMISTPRTEKNLVHPKHKLYEGESVFDEASVGCRIADNALLRRDRESLNNAHPVQVVDTLTALSQQMSAMHVVLRPIVEESALLKEKMTEQESSFRQDREKLSEELERHKRSAKEEAKKAADALKLRDASEKKALKLKKELEKKEGELAKAQKELSAAEDEMARLAKKREEEDAAAIREIETAFVNNVVQPKLAGMKEESYRLGYGEGFSACKKDVLAERPDLAEFLDGLKYIFEGEHSAPETSEQLDEASEEHTVDDAEKETDEEAANNTATAETIQDPVVPADRAQGLEAPVIEGDVAGSDQIAA